MVQDQKAIRVSFTQCKMWVECQPFFGFWISNPNTDARSFAIAISSPGAVCMHNLQVAGAYDAI